jgi:hypothetical protein
MLHGLHDKTVNHALGLNIFTTLPILPLNKVIWKINAFKRMHVIVSLAKSVNLDMFYRMGKMS